MDQLINYITILIVFFVVYLSALVTFQTIRHELFESQQKTMICILSWVVPLIVPVIAIVILSENKPAYKKSRIYLLDLIFLSWIFSESVESSKNSDLSSLDNSYSDGPSE